MSEPASKITSNDIKQAIKASFPPPAYQTFFEVSNQTGHSIKTYADAVAVGVWPSTGHEIKGYEVKVSRGDFLNEMKNPGKSMPIYRHCHRWYLACPAGMVKSDELPATWGLVEFTGSGASIRTKKLAPLLTPEPITPGFLAALVRRAGEQDAAAIASAVRAAEVEWNKRLEDKVSQRLREKQEFRDGAGKILDAMKAEFGERLYTWDVDKIVKAVRVAHNMNLVENWSGPLSLLGMLEDEASRFRETLVNAGLDVPARKKAVRR